MVSFGESGRRVTGKPLFHPGVILVTPGASEVMKDLRIVAILIIARHVSGDWGQIDPEDRGLNEEALKNGSRIFSVYKFEGGTIWVITEADRESTTILTPDEY